MRKALVQLTSFTCDNEKKYSGERKKENGILKSLTVDAESIRGTYSLILPRNTSPGKRSYPIILNADGARYLTFLLPAALSFLPAP